MALLIARRKQQRRKTVRCNPDSKLKMKKTSNRPSGKSNRIIHFLTFFQGRFYQLILISIFSFCLPDSNFVQQRLKTRPAEVTSVYIAVMVIIIGIFFLPAGVKLTNTQSGVRFTELLVLFGPSDCNFILHTQSNSRDCGFCPSFSGV